MKKTLLIVSLATAIATVSFAQDGALPPGKWWRQVRVVEELGLTEDQQSQLDSVFRSSASELIDLKAEVEKRSLTLRNEMEQTQLDRQSIQRAAESLGEARSRLFQRELMMFIDMRSVLSTDQWTRFRRVLETREAIRRDQRQRGGMRPDPMRPGVNPRRGGTTPRPNPGSRPPGTKRP